MIRILPLTVWLIFHPVHVSMTSIDLIPDTDSLKVFVRIYYDDFLHDYNVCYNTEYTTENNPDFPTELLNKYLNENVIILINNKKLEGKLLNHIILDNEISANLLCRAGKKPKTVTVKNLILTGLYQDQANMVIIRIKGLEEGIRLTPSETERTFILK